MRHDYQHVEFTSTLPQLCCKIRTNHLRSYCIVPISVLNHSCNVQNKRHSLFPHQGKQLFLGLEHMLWMVGLREADELSRKEQLAELTSQVPFTLRQL